MTNKKWGEKLGGVWSAAPTPLDEKMRIDVDSIKRMIDHHIRLMVNGLFLAGTNGEGPWMPERERHLFVKTVIKYAKGKMLIAAQVTDNSSARILENIRFAKDEGADIAVIAPPCFQISGRPDIESLYMEAIRQSPLPVGIYDRGHSGCVFVPNSIMKKIYMEPKVVMVKDSSADLNRCRLALACRRKRPELKLLNGWEFNCVEYLKNGYDGLLLGGGVFNAHLAWKIIEAVKTGDLQLAEKLQQRMNKIMYAVYGGKQIKCWLSGEKKLLVEMGIFRTWKNYLNYPLTDTCARAINRVLEKDMDVLMPAR